MLIYAIDDCNITLRQYNDYFFRKGHTIRTFSKAEELFRQLGQTVPDTIICDLVMPEMDGTDVVRRIKEIFPETPPPIIIATARHEPEYQIMAEQYGCLYWKKSGHLNELEALLCRSTWSK